MQNFSQQIQTSLSHKQKTFSEFFNEFLKCAWNIEHFGRKEENPRLIISNIIECKSGSYLNV